MNKRTIDIGFIIKDLVNEIRDNMKDVDDCTSFITSLIYDHFKDCHSGKVDISEFAKYLEIRLQKYKDGKIKKVA